MAHIQQVLGVADKEGLGEASAAREVETVDVYCESTSWLEAKEKLRAWLEAFPEEKTKWRVWEGDEVKTVGSSYNFWL